MPAPRPAFAAGLAAVAGAWFAITGRLDVSVPTVILLLLAARAAASVPDPTPSATRALRAQIAVVPAWVLAGLAASTRAGSASLQNVLGANAVAGAAIFHGPPLTVLAMIAGMVAAALAVAAPCVAGEEGLLATSAGSPARLEGLALLAQSTAVAALFAAPQVVRGQDLVPWVVVASVVGAIVVATVGTVERAAPLLWGSTALAVVSLAGVVIGGAP